MKIVVFGLTVTSSWGNGHATLWRGLCRALGKRGHQVVFFERDVPYYAMNRDLWDLPGGQLVLYPGWQETILKARRECEDADVAMVTSYCPDSAAAAETIWTSGARISCFYDMDTPITLASLERGRQVDYIPAAGLGEFDIVLSYTGGRALSELRDKLGATRTAPLYGSVDPENHKPANPDPRFEADLSYLGTYAEDRQAALNELFIDPSRRAPEKKFLIGGAQYPQDFPWTPNVYFVKHVAPADHPAFYSSSRLTLNITRKAMVEMGFCPSGRLFEAAACGVPVISDSWEGLDQFFTPGEEIIVAGNTCDTLDALEFSDQELTRIAKSARERTLSEHTADVRAREFERIMSGLGAV